MFSFLGVWKGSFNSVVGVYHSELLMCHRFSYPLQKHLLALVSTINTRVLFVKKMSFVSAYFAGISCLSLFSLNSCWSCILTRPILMDPWRRFWLPLLSDGYVTKSKISKGILKVTYLKLIFQAGKQGLRSILSSVLVQSQAPLIWTMMGLSPQEMSHLERYACSFHSLHISS